jgi:hypothetical protein
MSPGGPPRVVFYSQAELHRHIGKEAADVAASSIPFKVAAWAVAYSSDPGKRRRKEERQGREATHEASARRISPNPASLSVPLLDPWRPRAPGAHAPLAPTHCRSCPTRVRLGLNAGTAERHRAADRVQL